MPRLGETTMVLTDTEMGILHSYLLNTEDEHMVNVSQMLRDISKAENWRGVVNKYITQWRKEDAPTILDAFPIHLVEPEDANLKALETLVETASQSVTTAREHLENCNYFLASVVELRKRYEEGQLTVK